ncbi:hypothetical protein I548_2831 [Mycobacterium intracellulare]|nr:hypothetical protein I548_2831 [Mycobacterium intracellulare]
MAIRLPGREEALRARGDHATGPLWRPSRRAAVSGGPVVDERDPDGAH